MLFTQFQSLFAASVLFFYSIEYYVGKADYLDTAEHL